jgi:PadR family transcriptional regulator AphA
MSPMVRRSLTIEYALLGFLQQGPMHGYQLHQQLNDPDGLGRIWRLKQARLYALLDRLEEDGHISSSLQQQENRPRRRIFQMTAQGQNAFQEWLSTPVQTPREMRQEFQAKLYFSQLAGCEASLLLIAVQRQVCQQWLASHKPSANDNAIEKSYAWLVDEFRIGQIQATLDWLDISQEKLEQTRKRASNEPDKRMK